MFHVERAASLRPAAFVHALRCDEGMTGGAHPLQRLSQMSLEHQR